MLPLKQSKERGGLSGGISLYKELTVAPHIRLPHSALVPVR